MELDKAIQSRKSIRRFSSKKPDWRDIIECIDAARYAPMAGNVFTLKFIIVDDKKKIEKIAEACQQNFVAKAHYLIVVCTEPKITANAYEKRGKIYCRQQAGAGIQNFLLKIQEAGLATCWVGDFVEDMIKRELSIPKEVDVEAVFPIGYGEKTLGKQRVKKEPDIDSLLYFNQYKEKRMKPLEKVNA